MGKQFTTLASYSRPLFEALFCVVVLEGFFADANTILHSRLLLLRS